MSVRWGVLTKVSNDKGPFKIATFEVEGKPIDATVFEPAGVQVNPVVGSLALIFCVGGDEGRAVALVAAPPAKRVDGQAAGETSYPNTETGNVIKHDKDGDTAIDVARDLISKAGRDQSHEAEGDFKAKAGAGVEIEASGGDVVIKASGIVHINPPA